MDLETLVWIFAAGAATSLGGVWLLHGHRTHC
jgi:hypothetical protein